MKTLERFEWTRSPSRLIGLAIKGGAEGEAPELAKLTFAHRSEKHCADGGSTESRTGGQASGVCVKPKGVHQWVRFRWATFAKGARPTVPAVPGVPTVFLARFLDGEGPLR